MNTYLALQQHYLCHILQAKRKWELFDGQIYETDNDFPPWKNFVIKKK